MEEHRRLLYVAMTRAEERLYIAGFEGKRTRPESCWHNRVSAAIAPWLEEVPADEGEGTVLRTPGWQSRRADGPAQPAASGEALPDWIATGALPETVTAPRAPSGLVAHGPAMRGPPREGPAGTERGTVIHRLLEAVPETDPEALAGALQRMAQVMAPGWSEADRHKATGEVLALARDPALKPVFAPVGRSEVTIAGTVDGVLLAGQIDRLVVGDDEVLVIDYKSDRKVPAIAAESPAGYLVQLAAYRVLIRQIHGDKPVRAALLWTSGPVFMEIPSSLLDDHTKLIAAS